MSGHNGMLPGTAIDFTTHDVFIEEIPATYADENVLSNNKIDIQRIPPPLLFDMSSLKYGSLGKPVAACWNAGKALKKKINPARLSQTIILRIAVERVKPSGACTATGW